MRFFYLHDINFNLRINSEFVMPNVRSFFYGSESTSNLGPKIWDIVLLELKQLTSVLSFKRSIKEWKP